MDVQSMVASFAVETAPVTVPPRFESGDRMSKAEFLRRYELMENVRAELIDGVVYVASPVRAKQYGEPLALLIGWITAYWAGTPGVKPATDSTLKLEGDNEPQPDLSLRLETAFGGASRIEDGYIVGAPEFVGEVAASSVSYDLHQKLELYRRIGVPEYLVWRVLDNAIDWFVLENGNYDRLTPDDDGLLRSEVFPGLWLDPQAVLNQDAALVLRRLQDGIGSPEHALFLKSQRDFRKS
jgi:Uma2 family endonuclease